MRSKPACPAIRIPATRLPASFWARSIAASLRDFAYYPRNRYKYLAMYAQDDWKATRKLTVNYGLRYDIFFPRYEKNDNLSTFRSGPFRILPPADVSARWRFSAKARAHRTKSFADTYWKAFGPRLGIAYQLTDKTVLRSGYGIYYAQGNANAGLRDSLQCEHRLRSATRPFADNGPGCHSGIQLEQRLSRKTMCVLPSSARRQPMARTCVPSCVTMDGPVLSELVLHHRTRNRSACQYRVDVSRHEGHAAGQRTRSAE